MPFALLLGACDDAEDDVEVADAERTAEVSEPQGRHRGDHRGKHHGDPAERAAKMMAELDADGDAALSRAEVAGRRHLDERFTKIDGDGDGKLTLAELVAHKASKRGRKHGGRRHHRDEADAPKQAHG